MNHTVIYTSLCAEKLIGYSGNCQGTGTISLCSLPAGLKILDDVLKYSYFKSWRYSSKLNSPYPRKKLPNQILMKK